MQEKGKSVPSYGIYLSILDPSLKVDVATRLLLAYDMRVENGARGRD